VLRSAYCLGASGVIATSKNCAPLSAIVSKASAGSLELLQLHATRNMPRTLADAADSGWSVLAASAERGSQPLTDVVVEAPTILVMGR
jgi:21S rRNA (GM2251-2'-O)-methyltransferase